MTNFLRHTLMPEAEAANALYSQAIQADRLVFISGQPLSIPTSDTSRKPSIEEQAAAVLEHLKAVSEEAGGSLKDMVQLNLYLTDMSQLNQVNQVIKRYFSQPYPCRTTLEVKGLENEADIAADGVVILNSGFSLEELAVIT